MREAAISLFAFTPAISVIAKAGDSSAGAEADAAAEDSKSDAVYFIDDVMPLVTNSKCKR